MIKIILVALLAIMFIACSKEKVYIDENGTEKPHNNKHTTMNPPVKCDTRGYAYYDLDTGPIPILQNTSEGVLQLQCNDL